MVIDAQTHVVSDDTQRFPKRIDAYTWPATTPDMVLDRMDAAGIDRSVLQQAYGVYGHDNSYLVDVLRRHPERFAGVCSVDQLAPTGPDALSDLVENHGMSAVRLVWAQEPGVLANPASFPLWQRASELRIPVVIAAQLADIPGLVTPLERFGDVAVSLEHYWGNQLGEPPYDRIKPVLDLARFPNVTLRIVSNNSYAAREATGSPHAFFALIAEHFEPRRLVWGSNYPGHWDKHGGVGERLELAREDLAFLGDDAARLIFGENALRFWPQRSPV